MANIKRLILILFLGGAFSSCTYEPPEPAEDPTNPRTPPIAGTADFSKYIAIGNAITAGFMDNALYLEGQQNAYPVILAERMKLINGGTTFNFPAFGEAQGAGFGGFAPGTTTPVGRFRFVLPTCVTNPDATKTLGMTPAPMVPGEVLSPFSGNRAALNNFSAPGTKSYHALIPGYGANPAQGNPFYWRFASEPAASLLSDAVAAKGTFFTYWLGSNDILSYAISGGSGNPNPGLNPADYSSNDMTNPLVFGGALSQSVNALLAVSATTKGAIATLPEVTKAPFFQVVNAGLTSGGSNAILPFNLPQALAVVLNAAYAQLGPIAAGVNFQAGKVNYPVITTATGLRNMDPTKDFLTLLIPQDSLFVGPINACNTAIRGGWGITKPIPARFVLDQAEAKLVTERVTAFNEIIRQMVAAHPDRLALVDMHAFFDKLDATRNNIAPGGYFSVDGVHPNPRGQAVIANEFMKAINATFGSTLPPVDTRNYRQNILPNP